MKKGLKIEAGLIVNLDNLCTLVREKKSMQLQMSSGEFGVIDIEMEGSGGFGIKVSINEFKRIERELLEYLGLEIEN